MTATVNVIFGPSGAGKTTYAHAFARREKAVAFILDDWMARLFGPDVPDPIEYDWMIARVQRCEAPAPVTRHGRDAGTTAVFAVASIGDAMTVLRRKGVEFLHDAPASNAFGRYAAFKAPGGNVHEIFETRA